jgi:hypothetical protein
MTVLRSSQILMWAACLAVIGNWVALTAFLAWSYPAVEQHLQLLFGKYSRPDAFDGLNNNAVIAWWIHTAVAGVTLAAVRCRRTDVLTVLLIGPSLAAIFLAFAEDWTDPAWFTIVSIVGIGASVGILVSLVYWPGKGVLNRLFMGPATDKALVDDERAHDL